MTPAVTIVIVNYNSGKYLRMCLESLSAQTLRSFETIVIDNNSTDDSMKALGDFPDVRRIHNSANRGFAEGQNQGFRLARGEFIVALNYDLQLDADFLAELLGALEQDSRAGWACGKMLNMSQEGRRLETIYAAGHTLAADRFHFLRGNGETDVGQYEQPEYVFGAPGAAAMYKRRMVECVRFNDMFFDAHFFTWFEDVDVDWRSNLAGWHCLFVPSAVAYHVGHFGEEYHEPYRSWRATYGIRNRWLLILSNESLRSVWKNRSIIIRYELSSVLFVVRSRLVGAYLAALLGVIKSIPYILSKRRASTCGPH